MLLIVVGSVNVTCIIHQIEEVVIVTIVDAIKGFNTGRRFTNDVNSTF